MGDEYGREVVKVGIDRVCARFGDFPHQHADDVEGELPPKRIIAGIGSQARELLADATLDCACAIAGRLPWPAARRGP